MCTNETNVEKYNMLTVLNTFVKNKRRYCECICDCGNKKVIEYYNVKKGITKSCGCLKKIAKTPRFEIGEKKEKLTVLSVFQKDNGIYYYRCICDCGNKTVIDKYYFGKTKSCGCVKKGIGTINRIGVRTGKLIILEDVEIEEKHYYKCKCDCGNETLIHKSNFEQTKSCGCLFTEYANTIHNNLTGQRFGRLVVNSVNDIRGNNGQVYYNCTCDCGATNLRIGSCNLTSGCSKSCGCLNRELCRERVWKGGVTQLTKYLRYCILEWRKDSFENTNYKCIITGRNGKLVAHHIISFRDIMYETLAELNLEVKEFLSDYSEKDLTQMKYLFVKKHYDYGFGAIITDELHKEFHSIYGVGQTGDIGLKEWEEFYENKTNQKYAS